MMGNALMPGKVLVPLKSISNCCLSSGMALTKRTCELLEVQLVVMRVRPTRANVTRASVRGRAFNERDFSERNFNQHNMAFSKRQFLIVGNHMGCKYRNLRFYGCV